LIGGKPNHSLQKATGGSGPGPLCRIRGRLLNATKLKTVEIYDLDESVERLEKANGQLALQVEPLSGNTEMQAGHLEKTP